MAATPANAQGVLYRVTEVAPPGAGSSVALTDVSDSGWVVGYTYSSTLADGFGFARDPASGEFIVLQPVPAGGSSQPWRVFDNGHSVGNSFSATSAAVPCTWTRSGSVLELRSPFASASSALDANGRGLVVGYTQVQLNVYQPLLWRHGVLSPGPTPPGKPFGWLMGVNHAGLMVGFAGASPKNGPTEGYTVDEAGTVTPIGALPGDSSSALYAVNSAGLAVGASGGGVGQQAITYEHGIITPLPKVTASSSDFLLRVNRHGTAVGFTWDNSFILRGILASNGSLLVLNDVLDPGTGNGWYIANASGLNNRGEIACSAANPAGFAAGCLLTPIPAPPGGGTAVPGPPRASPREVLSLQRRLGLATR